MNCRFNTIIERQMGVDDGVHIHMQIGGVRLPDEPKLVP